MYRNSKDGFTLLEMLTVVGILGILMAGAFTGLSHAQRQARVAKAQGEVRQIVSAWFAYEMANDDWPGTLPEDGSPIQVSVNETSFAILLGEREDTHKEKRVYLAASLRNGFFLDPWGTPYRLKVTEQDMTGQTIEDTFFAAVTFPNRNRPLGL